MTETKEQLTIPAFTDYPERIASALWRMHDARTRTVKALKDLPEAALDWQATGLQNSIGTLLYHIAAIEIDWLYEEVLQQAWLPEISALFPYPVRNEQGHLYRVHNSWDDHMTRLRVTRACFMNSFKGMTVEDYQRPRLMPRYDVTPQWVVHHLSQHEAEHRGEILTLRTLYEATV